MNQKDGTSISKSTSIWNMNGKQTVHTTGLIYYSLTVSRCALTTISTDELSVYLS